MNLKELNIKVEQINKELKCTDFSPGQFVKIQTDEGFIEDIPSAFAVQIGDWFVIFAEHHEPLTFHVQDVTEILEYKVTKYFTEIKSWEDKQKELKKRSETMPVRVEKRGEKYRIVDPSGKIAKNQKGTAIDGGGHSNKQSAVKQAQAVNIIMHIKK